MTTPLAYCDYIAHTVILPALRFDILTDGVVASVERVKMDLEPEEGYMLSTSKSIVLADVNGKEYKITIEEL